MTSDVENLVLEHLRAIRADVSDVKVRMTSLEENTAAMNRRLDNMDRRIERIEKQLELVEAYASKSAWNQFPEAY
jgi:predicted  nucleic acid-binding Zn-ribbon protein